MKFKVIVILVFGWVLTSCSEGTINLEETEEIVIEGYLFSGNQIDSIRITQLIPLLSDGEASYEIEDANVFIDWKEESYLLTPYQDVAGVYYYNGSDLKIRDGETYALSFEYFNKDITASTIVPTKPTGLSISDSRIEIKQINEFQDLLDRGDPVTVEIYWDNQNGDYYFADVNNIDSNPEEIITLDFGGNEPNLNFTIEPTNLDVFNILPFSLTHYGNYRVVVYHVNQEYVDLYESSEQDSRNLTEPPSNVENGLGIFTSFSSDTLTFRVIKP